MEKIVAEQGSSIIAIGELVRPILEGIIAILLSLMASWTKNVSREMTRIREFMVKHDEVSKNQAKDIAETKEIIKEHSKEIAILNTQMAKLL